MEYHNNNNNTCRRRRRWNNDLCIFIFTIWCYFVIWWLDSMVNPFSFSATTTATTTTTTKNEEKNYTVGFVETEIVTVQSKNETSSKSSDVPSKKDQSSLVISSILPNNNGTTSIVHLLWGRPNATVDLDRIYDTSSYTGCCDDLVELAIRSYLYHMPPPQYSLWLWNLGGWDATAFLQQLGLKEFVQVKYFHPNIEFQNDTHLQYVYQTLQSIVPKSDLVRYTLMRNYGGSYFDLDGVLIRTPSKDSIPRMNISPATERSNVTSITCTNVTYAPRPARKCILSNGAFWKFPPHHIIFTTLLNLINKEQRTCGSGTYFFCYGPQWMSQTLVKNGISNPEKVGVQPTVLLRDRGQYQSMDTVIISHWDFDKADNCATSTLLTSLCRKYGVTNYKTNST